MIENEVLKNMKTRFSCRKYKPDPVEKEKLEAVIDAAKYAANGHHLEAAELHIRIVYIIYKQ